MDGFAGVFVFKGRSDFTGVVFTTHGPAHFGGLFPVSLFVVDGSLEGRLGGRGKGRSTGEKSGEDEELVLSLTQDPKRYEVRKRSINLFPSTEPANAMTAYCSITLDLLILPPVAYCRITRLFSLGMTYHFDVMNS